MDSQVLFEKKPLDKLVNKYVEKYQFYHIENPCYLKTIPNGRMECWKIFQGGFDIWSDPELRFKPASILGGYPATKKSLLFRITDRLYCLNIKLKLNSISIKAFQNLYPEKLQIKATDLSEINALANLSIKDFFNGKDINVAILDHWLKPVFEEKNSDNIIDEILILITERKPNSVAEMAIALDMNTKTLYRKFQKHFKLSPKELLSICRFEQTSAHIKNNTDKNLTEALSFGYHDQSHFVKESKRITGFSPKQLFNNMQLSTHDIMMFDLDEK